MTRLTQNVNDFVATIDQRKRPDDVLNALDDVVADHALRVFGVWQVPLDPADAVGNRTIYYHKSVPKAFHSEWSIQRHIHGASALAHMARLNRGYFTFAECKLASKNAGVWMFDLMRKHIGAQDGLCYPVGTGPFDRTGSGLWVVLFWSPKPVNLSDKARLAIRNAAEYAAFRLKRMVNGRPRTRAPRLSQRELAMYQSLADGQTVHDLMEQFRLKETSVRTYLNRGRVKIRARSREQAIATLFRWGLLR